MAWRGVLALTMVVRDEEEILPTNRDYHFAQGVDVALVVDHGSSDATPAILSDYARTGRLRWLRDGGGAQSRVMRYTAPARRLYYRLRHSP